MLGVRYEKQGLGGPVVIKRVLSPSTYERRQRLKEEVQLAYRLSHPAGDLRDALRACLSREQQDAGGRLYGRKEVAEELARLITDASAWRDQADPGDEGLLPSGLEAHEVGVPPSRGRPRT